MITTIEKYRLLNEGLAMVQKLQMDLGLDLKTFEKWYQHGLTHEDMKTYCTLSNAVDALYGHIEVLDLEMSREDEAVLEAESEAKLLGPES